MKIADVLEKAADLIEPEGAWTQSVVGRDARGRALDTYGLDRAVCFCATGAIWRASGVPRGEDDRFVMGSIFPLVRRVIGTSAIGTWNDHPRRKQPEVVAKLREAASMAREQGL